MCYLSFSPCAFNILSLSLILVSLITRCIGGYSHQYTSLGLSSLDKPPWVYPAWDSLPFLDLVDHSLSHVREVFSYYLLKYFLESFLSLSSPYGTPLVHLMLSQKFLTLSSHLFILFSARERFALRANYHFPSRVTFLCERTSAQAKRGGPSE